MIFALPIYFISLAAPSPAKSTHAERAAAIAIVLPLLREYADNWSTDGMFWRDEKMGVELAMEWLEIEAEDTE